MLMKSSKRPYHALFFSIKTPMDTIAAAIEIIVAVINGLSFRYSIIEMPDFISLASATSASVRPHYGSLQVVKMASTASVMSP